MNVTRSDADRLCSRYNSSIIHCLHRIYHHHIHYEKTHVTITTIVHWHAKHQQQHYHSVYTHQIYKIYIYIIYIQWFRFYVSLYTYEITCLTSHIYIYNISSFRIVSQSYRFCCQCATCHVILEKPFFDQLQGPGVREAVWVGLGWSPQSSTELWWVFSEWLDFWTEKFVALTFLNRTYLQKRWGY